MKEQKYQLVPGSEISFNGRVLYRIMALKDFRDVCAGEVGGYVESGENLSQDEKCWIYDDSKVYGGAVISERAIVKNNSEVYDFSFVDQDTVVDNSKIHNFVSITHNAHVVDSEVYGYVEIDSDALILRSKVHDNPFISVHCKIEDSEVFGLSRITYCEIRNSTADVTRKILHEKVIDHNIETDSPI